MPTKSLIRIHALLADLYRLQRKLSEALRKPQRQPRCASYPAFGAWCLSTTCSYMHYLPPFVFILIYVHTSNHAVEKVDKSELG